tara:strand:- start:13916 stop:14839 length:924 start_codon:yes stop_codon:yes gene_type:complete
MTELNDLKSFSHKAIVEGSKSFTFAGYLFAEEVRDDAFALYAWCRHCDDVIDNAQSSDLALKELIQLKKFTSDAMENLDVELPLPFQTLRHVVLKYNIPRTYPIELLNGMEMDVSGFEYKTRDDLELYCYRVAGVVGLMMAHIMGVSDQKALNAACALGKAMQLTNISRDIFDDYRIGRIYIPQSWLDTAGIDRNNLFDPEQRESLVEVVDRILAWADNYYEEGHSGIGFLNWRCALAIQSASNIYREIGSIVRKKGATAWNDRAHTSSSRKTLLALKGAVQIVNKTAWQISKPWFPSKNLDVLDFQ